MRKLIAAAVSIASLGFIGLAATPAAQAAPASPSVAQTATPGVLSNGVGDAKYNATSGIWRLAAHGTNTEVEIFSESGGSYFLIQDTTTGNYLDWVNGTGITETSDSGLARAHWAHYTGCNPGFEWQNVYATNWLDGEAVGNNLSLAGDTGGSCTSGLTWQFTGTWG